MSGFDLRKRNKTTVISCRVIRHMIVKLYRQLTVYDIILRKAFKGKSVLLGFNSLANKEDLCKNQLTF